MVFGRKALEDTLVKPSPPTVDQILEDLKCADPEDPVYTLDPNNLTEAATEETESDAEKNYSDVIAYVAKEKGLNNLQEKIFADFDTLLNSQKELQTVSGQVAEQLENIKKKRREVSQKVTQDINKVKATSAPLQVSSLSSSSEDLC